ncbi:hypothetical protein GV792_04745 [Nocardia cyriacigeorgica]|uniref:DUF6221 family protein n=1 Tax=Nocardia cyriacigeorgica TaxID=135487 RepID=UPI0013BE1C28|nr:DUF6221 family protein [Nocardia cyriacigeorgica]NEW49351.1 hypothetical protein [Nocardia cyriacigeorgica]
MTIEEFIDARLWDDHHAATGAWLDGEDRGDEWSVYKIPRGDDELAAGIFVFARDAQPYSHVTRIRECETGHIERHDPARVARQIKAFRAIVASTRRRIEEGWGHQDIEHLVVADLAPIAAIWSNHPDFRPEWSGVS